MLSVVMSYQLRVRSYELFTPHFSVFTLEK